jgi:Rrf2 family protein
MGLQLTRAADYAILALLHIGSLPEGVLALKGDIARAQNIPPAFLAKILRQLVDTGVLRSNRGVNGGFGLQRSAADINLLDIVEGIEGPIQLTDCAPDPDHCALSHDCPASGVWLEVQRRMTELLRRTTLEAMLSAPRRNRRAVYNVGA